jgi:hypothetical protein
MGFEFLLTPNLLEGISLFQVAPVAGGVLAFPHGVYWERERLARTPSEPSYSETVQANALGKKSTLLTLSNSVGVECIRRYTSPALRNWRLWDWDRWAAP